MFVWWAFSKLLNITWVTKLCFIIKTLSRHVTTEPQYETKQAVNYFVLPVTKISGSATGNNRSCRNPLLTGISTGLLRKDDGRQMM